VAHWRECVQEILWLVGECARLEILWLVGKCARLELL